MVPGLVFREAFGLFLREDRGVVAILRGYHLFEGTGGLGLASLLGNLLRISVTRAAPELIGDMLSTTGLHPGTPCTAVALNAEGRWGIVVIWERDGAGVQCRVDRGGQTLRGRSGNSGRVFGDRRG
jgi:hypothetical protein